MTGRVVRVHRSWAEVPAEAWDALVADGSPFLEHEFLLTAEETGCATADTGWFVAASTTTTALRSGFGSWRRHGIET